MSISASSDDRPYRRPRELSSGEPIDISRALGRDEVIAKLRLYEAELRAFGPRSLYLFGSHARDEGRPDSDIDVFVEWTPDKEVGFLEYTGLIIFLEDLFRRPIDVSLRKNLHRMLKADIEASALRVF